MSNSTPRKLLDFVLAQAIVLASEATILELDEVLRRDKFRRYIADEIRLEFVAAFVRQCELINVQDTVSVCRDPKDNKFLELALSAQATHILSGDDDLLVLHPFRGIEILSPSAFLSLHSPQA
jgi:putative PIN family toxin of toxin-antitoxin system